MPAVSLGIGPVATVEGDPVLEEAVIISHRGGGHDQASAFCPQLL